MKILKEMVPVEFHWLFLSFNESLNTISLQRISTNLLHSVNLAFCFSRM
jgi:hypothetical protein